MRHVVRKARWSVVRHRWLTAQWWCAGAPTLARRHLDAAIRAERIVAHYRRRT